MKRARKLYIVIATISLALVTLAVITREAGFALCGAGFFVSYIWTNIAYAVTGRRKK